MEDYDHQLERHVRALDWPDERVAEFTRFVMHSATGSAEFALEILNFSEEVRGDQDFAMRGADITRAEL